MTLPFIEEKAEPTLGWVPLCYMGPVPSAKTVSNSILGTLNTGIEEWGRVPLL